MPVLRMEKRMTLRKIISGGQTGADMGGLLAAKELGLETGGTAPGGYKTEKGRNLDLRDTYGLTQFGSYPERTHINVRDSDVTVIFGDITEPGSKLTIKLCQDLMKPFRINPPTLTFLKFLVDHQVQVLNIAGNRESKHPGIEEKVREFLVMTIGGH